MASQFFIVSVIYVYWWLMYTLALKNTYIIVWICTEYNMDDSDKCLWEPVAAKYDAWTSKRSEQLNESNLSWTMSYILYFAAIQNVCWAVSISCR